MAVWGKHKSYNLAGIEKEVEFEEEEGGSIAKILAFGSLNI